MKTFKKLLILKWHYIESEFIELGKVNFLTGKNGSGKSTIIDAMQVVLLGSTNGSFFNKAANEKSDRSLFSYAKGELSDDEDAGSKYLRNDDFTSIIAMEVYDDAKQKTFTIGIQIDVASDNSMTNRFFLYNAAIPRNRFVQNNLVMNIGELKAFALKEEVKLEQFTTQKAYQETLLAKLGNVNRKYFSLLKKAVPFSPITDIKGFITEFICDTEKKVNIQDMQNNIRYYENMRLEAEDVEKRIAYLDEIDKAYKGYKRLEGLIHLQGYLVAEGQRRLAQESLERIEKVIVDDRRKHESFSLQLKEEDSRYKALEQDRDNLSEALMKSDVFQQEKEINSRIHGLSEECQRVGNDKKRITNEFKQRCVAWDYRVDNVDTALYLEDVDPVLVELDQVKANVEADDLMPLSCDEMRDLNGRMEEISEAYGDRRRDVTKDLNDTHQEIKAVMKDIEGLEKGRKTVPRQVADLKKILEDTLKERHQSGVDVHMVCDRIEVSDAKWQNAVEGYLHLQKFYLYVAPKFFDEALEIYETHKKEGRIYDAGLIDMEKVMAKSLSYKSGSLAEVIEGEDPLVSSYMNYLLGKVMKVETVGELRDHKTSITPTCMLYKGYVARQLNPSRYNVPFIGKMAVKHQLEKKRSDLSELQDQKKVLTELENKLNALSRLKSFGEHLIDDWQRNKEPILLLPSKLQALNDWKVKLTELDRTNIIQLTSELQEVKGRITKKNDLITEIKAKLIGVEKDMDVNRYQRLPEAKMLLNKRLLVIEEDYDASWVMEIGRHRFDLEMQRLKSISKIVVNFTGSQKGNTDLMNKAWDNTLRLRNDYIREFQGTYDINARSNQDYEQLMGRLKETDLPSYKEKIEEAIHMAQREFRDDFLSKLKFNIDTVKGQIKELNAALKHISFGQDDYMFKVTPNPNYRKYYEMITDPNLLDGFNIFSMEFQDKYRDVIDELFKKIVDIGEGAISADERAEIERNIAKYTDYRTYLDFDLVVIDGRGNKSHLSKMISKKSGGETQTPFYISVLASFFRIYRMNLKNNDTSRLVIFDEAFSKMDHERIEVCLRLLKELGFQALISAPSEKIANIMPLVDRTLCVIKTESATVVKPFTKEDLLDEEVAI